MPGGYHNEIGYTYNILGTSYNFSDHLNIILAYHGTINLATPANNGQATMTSTERAWFNTYENTGENTGFKYSRNIIGNRKSNDIPNSADAVIAGYHNNTLLGGSGARQSLTWTSAVWPNVITSSIFRSTTELQTGAQSVIANEVLPIKYKYRSYANASDVTFYVDIDRDPYNNNNTATIGTQNLPLTGSTITEPTSTINWTISGLTSGTKYYVYAKINDGTRTRFVYLNYEFSLTIGTRVENANLTANILNIFPNPTTGIVNLSLSINKESIASYKVTDLNGKTILSGNSIPINGKIDISYFNNGIYYLQIVSKNETLTGKIVKK
jgi:hypothetical protein